jgi:anti-sigma B factor antagonist
MNNLNIDGYRNGSVAVLNLHGDIRFGENNEIHNTLRFLIEQNERRILLNFTDVAFMDSGGLGEVVAGFATLKINGGELKVFGLNGRVREIMELTGLVALLDVYDDEQEAIESFQETFVGARTETIAGNLDGAMVS